MPIDPAELSQVQWDEPKQAAPAAIDPSQVVWDDAPRADFSGVTSQVMPNPQPDVPRPYADSTFNKVVDFFAGPAPIQGNTLEERQADYQGRNPALRGLVGSGQAVDSVVRGIGQLTGTSTPGMDAASRDTNQVVAGDLPTSAGKFATDVAMTALPGRAVTQLPTFGARMLASAGLGAGWGGLQAEDEAGGRARNAAYGAIGGAAGEAAGAAIGRLGARLSPEVMALYNSAKDKGIDLLPHQLSDSQFVKRAQNILRNMPFTGANAAWQRQVDQFNQAVSRTFGADAPKITPEVFAQARQRIGDQFDQLSAQSTLKIDDDLLNKLGGIAQDAKEVGEDGTIRAVNSMIDRLLTQSKDGQLPGLAYKSLDSQLGKLMASGGEKAWFLGQLRDAVREAMDTSIPQELKQAWATARGQYRNLKTVEPLVAKAVDGSLTPAQLMGRVTADKAGKSAMATGRAGELGELARIGQAMKPPPTSGTAENMLVGGMLNPMNWPGYGAPGLVGFSGGRAINSNWLARVMASEARPAITNYFARLAGPSGVAVGPAVAAGTSAVPVPEPRGRNNGR